MLREQKGNMYSFVTHTWNPIKGRCSHDCEYCYMKRFPLKGIRLDERELRTDLGTGNFIFVGSDTDMWANDVPSQWIFEVLRKCGLFDNTYLFQSKNPSRFIHMTIMMIPGLVRNVGKVIYGTTIETNRDYIQISKAPNTELRMDAMKNSKYSDLEQW